MAFGWRTICLHVMTGMHKSESNNICSISRKCAERNLVRQLRWYDKESDRLFAAYDRSLYTYSFEKEEWNELGVLSEDILNSADVRFERLNDSVGLIRNVETDWLINWRSNQLHQLDLSSNNEVRKRSGIPGIQWGYVTNDVLHILRKSDKVSAGFFESFYELKRWKKWSTARLYTPILWIRIGYMLISLSVLSVLVYIFWGSDLLNGNATTQIGLSF